MPGHHFISYSTLDALDFALKLHDALASDGIPVWLDKRKLHPGDDWDSQIAEAIRDCETLLFVLTPDSVQDNCTCKQEWTRALKYKKPIVPLHAHRDAELPFRLEPRQWIDFTGDLDSSMAKLRQHLQWLNSPEGVLHSMKDRLKDAERDLRRPIDPTDRARIKDDIALLKKQIKEQEELLRNPQAAAQRTEQSIATRLERERQPERPVSGVAKTKFINPPPGIAPNYFQDRHVETKLIGDFLLDESKRMMTVVGRAGIGKTAMVCRLLKSLEGGRLPDDGDDLKVDGIVYLSSTGTRVTNVPNLLADLCKLLPDERSQELDTFYKNPQVSTTMKTNALLAEFPYGRTIVLFDNFETVLDAETMNLRDTELDDALHALLNAPHHSIKVIVTTRVAPHDLTLVQPGRQRRIDLDKGLESPFAENILREMDADSKVGLKHAPANLLNSAREYTRGFPRALEALFAILSADRYTTLSEILAKPIPPENVVEALVGEAFNRLDPTAQRVMQALAVYNRPVTAAAVDYLLQPYLASVDGTPVLNRLVNMQFVRKEAGRYYLHPVDRAYAFDRVPRGMQSDYGDMGAALWTQHALLHRGAEYFKQTRKPRDAWKTIDDLGPQLAEFDLRCAAEDFDTAMKVLIEFDKEYLLEWGLYRLQIEMYERLENRLTDGSLKEISLGNLGSAYCSMGQYEKAIVCGEKALTLACEAKDRKREGVWLGDLGICYASLGQMVRAIEYYSRALHIAREVGNKLGEEINRANLASCYGDLGQTDLAISYYEEALTIDREEGSLLHEGTDLASLAEVLIDKGQYDLAEKHAAESARIGKEACIPTSGSYGNSFLALARLYRNDVSGARIAIDTAGQYDEPDNNHYVQALLGLISLREDDHLTAQEAFMTAVTRADEMLACSGQNFDALDTKGLALCGLGLLLADAEADKQMKDAVAAYRAARAINKDAGIVARVVRLLDTLALADPHGAEKLTDVRKAAAGE